MLSLAGKAVACPDSDPIHGPILVRNLRPYQAMFLQFMPEAPDIVGLRRSSFAFQFDVANNFLIPPPHGGPAVTEDNEVQRLMVLYHLGTGRNSELSATMQVAWRNGGIMDPILSWWHKVIGVRGDGPDHPAGRDAYPQFQSILRLTDGAGNTVVDGRSIFGLGDATVGWKRELFSSPRSGAAARVVVKLPIGNAGGLLGSGAVDGGAILDARYNIGRSLVLYGCAGYAWYGHSSRVPNQAPGLAQCVVAAQFTPNSRDGYIVQIDRSGPAVHTGNAFADGVQVTGSFAYRRKLSQASALTVSFTENGDIHDYTLPNLTNIGPDFTTSVGVVLYR